jgi:CRISPR-associated endonuclease/helicase Cas3
MTPLAKSANPPVYLDDHIRHLIEQVDVVLTPRAFVRQKYEARTGEDLRQNVTQSARWHDEGKKDPQWQTACQKDHEITKATGKESGRNLMRVGVRHELISLVEMERLKANVSLPVKVAVAAHHNKLSRRQQDRWKERAEFQKHWNEFEAEASMIRTSDRSGVEQALRKRYFVSGPRALLQMVDHRASAAEQNEPLPEFTPFAYSFPVNWTKRGVQKLIEDLWDEPFAVLRAPTGAGKTDAALLWAQHQVECGRADRLVIAMPTRFTANALAISTAETLSATGLYHSSAWYQRIKDREPTVADKKLIDKEQELARRLETPVTVTTIDHLCICLTGTREDHHAIFFSLAHSCVVIDEADFYDDFTQQNIVVLLRVLKELNVPVLLMSATVPESALHVYATSGLQPKQIYEDKTDYERPRCVIHRYGAAQQPDDLAELLQRALEGEPTIIYANTVNRAQAYYRWFKARDVDDVVLYHSRFTEPHKAEKENRLRDLLGKEAWEKGEAHGIAILTQIGEISVNISADLMISDLCPIDRLAQRAGRLSRFRNRSGNNETPGQLFIIVPERVNKKTGLPELYPAPYGHYESSQKGWQINDALRHSNELLVNGEYAAKTFVDLVNQLYPEASEAALHVKENKRELEKLIVTNWLILPKEELQQDDDRTKEWSSRDIPPQYTIYADYDYLFDGNVFDNRSKRREFEIRHGIQCYAYEFNAAHKNNWITETSFFVREEEEKLFLVRPQFYDQDMGLHFDDESGD